MAIFTPEKYRVKDESQVPFIDEQELWDLLHEAKPTREGVQAVIQKAMNKKRLSLAETALLLKADEPELIDEIKSAANALKRKIYGERIVLFAPLYVGNYCTNNCEYCGFKVSNKDAERSTLSEQQLIDQTIALEKAGHKRLILVYGEHPQYNAKFIAHSVRTVYKVKEGNGEIRRVNINAAPLDIDGFKTVHEAGIGTYQIFQETYHHKTYLKVHKGGKKRNYDYRLTGLDRAMEAGIDDVGIGALFGLYDWRFEMMALVRHVNHLEACYKVGPHTISFPRIQDAESMNIDSKYFVSDEDFTRLVAILRLAVPYTGLILTAREPAHIRDEVLRYGVSQIDGGTNIEMGGYTTHAEKQNLKKEQFRINDDRTLSEVMHELIKRGSLPSFCTSCYRKGRTGEHFMEFSVPGFIKRFCQPNAMLTLAEYLEDYATPEVKTDGYALINKELRNMEEDKVKEKLELKLEMVKKGVRDLNF